MSNLPMEQYLLDVENSMNITRKRDSIISVDIPEEGIYSRFNRSVRDDEYKFNIDALSTLGEGTVPMDVTERYKTLTGCKDCSNYKDGTCSKGLDPEYDTIAKACPSYDKIYSYYLNYRKKKVVIDVHDVGLDWDAFEKYLTKNPMKFSFPHVFIPDDEELIHGFMRSDKMLYLTMTFNGINSSGYPWSTTVNYAYQEELIDVIRNGMSQTYYESDTIMKLNSTPELLKKLKQELTGFLVMNITIDIGIPIVRVGKKGGSDD